MKSLFRYIIFLILLNFSFAAKAETIYPIQLYAAMLPPYTNCLGDYINGDMNRLKLSAVVRDMSKHSSMMSISVLMRVKSGNTVYLETTTPVQQIINVQGSMVDIRTENLFTAQDHNAKNLVGRGNFMSNGYCLPEGAYEFVYQVFDGTNKKLPLSEPISIYCFLNQAEPPVGITPLDGECLDSKANQSIIFSWMDAVAIGPKYKEYSVEVKEQNGALLPSQQGLLPMFGAHAEVNDFSVVTQKSYNTNTLVMQNTSGKFQEGKTYLWRVKAVPTKVNGSVDENFAYKNDGYSEWMSFKYGGCSDTVFIPKADSIDINLGVDMTKVDTSEETGTVVVHWEDIFNNTDVDKYCAYELYVYKADNESAAKTVIPIKDGDTKEYTFENLERGEEYKSYIVGLTGCGTPDTVRTPHSDTVSFKLKKLESDSCMVNIDPAKCGKDDLITTLEKGNSFTANDHNVVVTITECAAGSVAGSFTGKGIVSCTIFKDKIGLNVEFKDIFVNKSNELCMGTVKVISSSENNLLINLNDLAGKNRTAPKAASQDFPYTNKVSTLEDLKKDVDKYKGEVVLVGDKEVYAVGNNGEIEKIGTIVDNACRPSTHSLDNSAGLIAFDVDEKYNEGKWSPYIDDKPSPFTISSIVNGYDRIGSYVIPWVSMVQGEARYIKAIVQSKSKTTGTGLNGKEKDIKFYCVTDSVMTELESEFKDGAFKVKVFGGQPDKKLTIVAMMNSTGSAEECAKNSKTIGEAYVYTMSYKKKTIHLVPVCTDAIGDAKTYADKINKVFAPLGRTYEFKFEDKFENEEVKSLIANGLNTEKGGNIFNNKTKEMKQLCRLYKHDDNVKIDHRADAYVFLLNQNTNSKIKGYMPRTNSEGFVFTEGMSVDQIAETMTHELCHGLYGLEHTFSYGIDTMALPENIMSYSTQTGRRPSKYFQWYNIENPSDYHLPFTDSAEDGEGIFDWFHWLGGNIDNAVSSSIKICKNKVDNNRSVIKKKDEFWEDVSLYTNKWSKGISYSKLSNYLNYSDYSKWNIKRDDNIPQKLDEIKNSREYVQFNDFESNSIYFWSGNYDNGPMIYICVYSFVNHPKISDYKVPDIITLTTHYRSQALYYGDKYSMIGFFSETGSLDLMIQFIDPSSKDIEKSAIAWAKKLLVDPLFITKEEAASMAAHVYGDQPDAILKNNWKADDSVSDLVFVDNSSGFKSKLYVKKDEMGNPLCYCYATAGTEDVSDWGSNADQVLGIQDAQYKLSMKNATKLKDKLNKPLFLTGHSLGGSLATYNSFVTGCPTITFNPAGTSTSSYDLYKNQFNFVSDGSQVMNYVMQGDVVNIANVITLSLEVGYYRIMYTEDGGIGGHSINNFLSPTYTSSEYSSLKNFVQTK